MHSPSEPDRSTRLALEDFAVRSRLASRRAQLDAAAVDAIEALGGAGIDALLLKGSALATALYGPDQDRGHFDIDLLVAPVNRAAAGRVLSELGYADVSSRRGVDDVAGVLHADVWSRTVAGFGNVIIDLHWRLDGCEAPADAAWDVLHADAGRLELGGSMVPTLGPAAMVLHVALHASQHGPGDAKAMADLRTALERFSAERWREAATLADRLGATEALAAGLRVLPAGAGLADQLGLRAAERLLWEIANRDARPRGTFHLEALSEARTVPERLYVVRRALLPSTAWIAWEMPWAARGGPYLAAAYVLHLMRAPAWALRALRYLRRRRGGELSR